MSAGPRLLIRSCDHKIMELCGSESGWLSPAELDELARLRDARRRSEWLAGRWLLKEVLRRNLTGACPGEIEVLSRDSRGRGQPPRVLLAGRLLPWHVSLAHDGGRVWAAVSTEPEIRVGIDVVPAEPVGGCFSDLWFSAGELRWLNSSYNRLLGPTLWAIKEAVYKATNRGEPFAPARIEVAPNADGFTWSCDGTPCGEDDCVSVRRTDGFIVVVAIRSGQSDD